LNFSWRSQQNEHPTANQLDAMAHLPNRSDWAKYTFPGIGSPDEQVVQRDDGLWSIGWADGAAGPFETRGFAEAVAAQGEGRHASATS
jgi:hypothetical protein